MGREIRRVLPEWEHPRDERGHFCPLFDQSYDEAAAEWLDGFQKWEAGEDPAREQHGFRYYWDWHGMPPDDEFYRPHWREDERTAWQVYETVSEGTPVSPVFTNRDDLRAWLLANGWSEAGAEHFIKGGWIPSGIVADGEWHGPGGAVSNFMATHRDEA